MKQVIRLSILGLVLLGSMLIAEAALVGKNDPQGGVPVWPEDKANQGQSGLIAKFGGRMIGAKCHFSRTLLSWIRIEF